MVPKGPWAAPGEFPNFRRTQGGLRDTWGAPGQETLVAKITLKVPTGTWGALGEFAGFRRAPRDPWEPWGTQGVYAQIVDVPKK